MLIYDSAVVGIVQYSKYGESNCANDAATLENGVEAQDIFAALM